MKETKIMKVFEQYIKKFDMNKGNIKAMYFHSIKMMELCKDIASNLGIFTEEEIKVCGLIGLFHDISKFDNKNKNFSVFLNDYIIDNKYNNLNLGDEISISLKPIKENLNNKFDSVDESSISNINDIFDEYIKNCIFYEKRAYDLLDNECKENKYKTYQVFDEYITNNLKNIVIMKLLSYEYSKKEGYDEYKCITNKGYNIIFKVTSYITYTVNIE